MAESTSPNGPDRLGQWLGYWFSRPLGKLAMTVLLCLLLAGSAWLDEHYRVRRGMSRFFAPSREDFWLSLQLGAVVGLAAFLADFLHNLARRVARPFRGRGNEQPRRTRLWAAAGAAYEALWGVLFLVPLFGLGLWFTWQGCLPLVPWVAPLAVVIPGMLLQELIFGAKLPGAAPQPAPVEN